VQRGRPRKLGRRIVDKDMPDMQRKPEDAINHCRWEAKIKGMTASAFVNNVFHIC